MPYTSFSDLISDVYKFYQEKEYQQAADKLDKHLSDFPDRKGTLLYWMMNINAHVNEERAIGAFQEAIDGGHWYTPNALKDDDPDLKSIVDDPEFKRLRETSKGRYEAARTVAKPELNIYAHGDGPLPTLIALHGNTRNAEKAAAQWTAVVEAGWLVAVPQSSQISGPDQYIWNDWDTSIMEVNEHYAALMEHGILEDQVFIGGFSMGGGLALRLALANDIPAKGYILVASALPDLDTLDLSKLPDDVRFYIFLGEKEDYSIDKTKQLADMLRANGNDVHLEIRPNVAHEYPPDFAETLRGMLNFVAA